MSRLIRMLFALLIGLSIWLIPYKKPPVRSSHGAAEQALHQRVLNAFHLNRPKLLDNPAVVDIMASPGTGEIWIMTDQPEQVPTMVASIPIVRKPAGVILLHAGGVQEHQPELQACPAQYEEVRQERWRYCNPVHDPQPLPVPKSEAIGGLRADEARAIFARHADQLRRMAGVETVSLGPQGILVTTDQPTALPTQVEGLSVYHAISTFAAVSYRPELTQELLYKRMKHMREILKKGKEGR